MADPKLKLNDVLDIHLAHQHITPLSDLLGDGYLYLQNPVIKNMRDAALRLGLVFTNQGRADYATMSHIGLINTLTSGSYPYNPNYQTIAQVEDLNPHEFYFSEITPYTQMVTILHHEAHALAYRLFRQESIDTSTRLGERKFVTSLLLGESFAVMCECISKYYAVSPSHEAILGLHARNYLPNLKLFRESLATSVGILGHHRSGKLICLSYLLWNFLYTRVEMDDLERMLDLCGARLPRSRKSAKTLLTLSQQCFHIPDNFRVNIAEFYFRLHGLNRRISALTAFDPLKFVERENFFAQGLDQLIEFSEAGVCSSSISILDELGYPRK
jgi:hypothetical protein